MGVWFEGSDEIDCDIQQVKDGFKLRCSLLVEVSDLNAWLDELADWWKNLRFT